ncbi:MAG: hypothetical protein ABI707_15820 [Ferruginibacter sp.]
MQKIIVIIVCWCWFITASAQPNINRVEYFIDTDPGFGRATSIIITPSANISNGSFTVPIGSLSTGIHILFIRSRNVNGRWSVTNSRFFYKAASTGALPNITRVEYFFDTDPGFGNATNIPVTAGPDLQNISFAANINTLSPGVHKLFIRSRDINGKWSITNNRFFYKSPIVSPEITHVEYYIDTDPGFGNATPIVVNPSINFVNFIAPVNISGLSAGNHKLFIRSRSASGYSITNVYTFPIAATAATPYINVNSITKKIMCARDSVKISFDAKGTYNAGNIFRVQLSNATGTFAATPPVIGAFTGTKSAIVNCQLPSHTGDGTNYRVRIISTSPVVTGVTGSDAITIHDRPFAQTITGLADVNVNETWPYSVPAAALSTWTWLAPAATITQTNNSASLLWNNVGLAAALNVVETNQYGCIGDTSAKPVNVYKLRIGDVPSTTTPCLKDSVTIAINTDGAFYATPAANQFVAELSNATGSFTTPTATATLTSGALAGNAKISSIKIGIPDNLPNGVNYKIRVRSTNPVFIGDTSAAISISKPSLGPDTTIYHLCVGETSNLLPLYNTTGLTATWNTANTTAAPPGTYRLIGINSFGCPDTAFAFITLEVARWTGTVSNNWHTAANWNINKVPGNSTHVIIPAGTPFPCVLSTANGQAASIQLRNGASLTTNTSRQVNISGQCATLPPN